MTDQYEDPPDWSELPPIFSVADVALIFNVHVNTVRRWVKLGQLKSYRWFGRAHVFPRDYILEFADPEQIKRISAQAADKWAISEETMNVMQDSRREAQRFYERFGMKP